MPRASARRKQTASSTPPPPRRPGFLQRLLTPAHMLLLQRAMRRGVITLLRERGWMTTLSALVGILILMELMIVVAFGVQGMQHILRAQTDLRLEVRKGATDQEVQEFFAAVRQQPSVEEVQYIPKEQAYEAERKRDSNLIQFLEEFKLDNPFPDTVAVTLRALSDYDAFNAFVKQATWKNVVDPAFLSHATDQEAQAHEMLRAARAGELLVFVFLFFVVGILLFVLMELTRRRALARSEEILVERLVGADDAAVLLPFVIESTLLLLCALAISIIVMGLFLFFALPVLVPALTSGGVFGALRDETAMILKAASPMVIVLEILFVPVLALLGAWLGLRPQLKSPRLSLAAN